MMKRKRYLTDNGLRVARAIDFIFRFLQTHLAPLLGHDVTMLMRLTATTPHENPLPTPAASNVRDPLVQNTQHRQDGIKTA
jgi:hypothetical protein